MAPVPGLRPSADAQRETLFNWLQPRIPGSRVLDLFAGTGALGFEAASRGAQAVVLAERHRLALTQLHDSAASLEATAVQILGVDSLRWLNQPAATAGYEPFDIVFVDPPFNHGWVAPSLQHLRTGSWLAPGAWVYVEQERNLPAPPDWQLVRENLCGEARGLLLTAPDAYIGSDE